MSTLTPTAPTVAWEALPKPRTDAERMAIFDAMLAELRETEARMDARDVVRQQLRRETAQLREETRDTLAYLKARR